MAISGAESEISLPGNGEESEISLPDLHGEDLAPGLTVDVEDAKDYEDTYYPGLSDYDISDLFEDDDAESQTNLPDEAITVTLCCAKLCKHNFESAEYKAFLSSLQGARATMSNESTLSFWRKLKKEQGLGSIRQ